MCRHATEKGKKVITTTFNDDNPVSNSDEINLINKIKNLKNLFSFRLTKLNLSFLAQKKLQLIDLLKCEPKNVLDCF